jgi:hypothetical protein
MSAHISLRSDQMVAQAMKTYPDGHAPLRCGIGDAAALCDALSDEIKMEGTSRGHTKKRALEDAALVKRCGDMIWAMREKVKRP